MLGLFNQDRLRPLRYCPIQIELELVTSQADAVTIETAEGFANGANWDISDIQCKCDLLALDNSLDNGYASHLLAGKSFSLISIPGIIQTNRLDLMNILALILRGL